MTRRPALGDTGALYCVDQDCGGTLYPDGRRIEHEDGCLTAYYERLEALDRIEREGRWATFEAPA